MKEIFDYTIKHANGSSIDFNSMISDINKLQVELDLTKDKLDFADANNQKLQTELQQQKDKVQFLEQILICIKESATEISIHTDAVISVIDYYGKTKDD